MRYEVPIVYKGQQTYIVDASSKEEAEAKARAAFNNGETPDLLGNEWERIDRIGEITELTQEPST